MGSFSSTDIATVFVAQWSNKHVVSIQLLKCTLHSCFADTDWSCASLGEVRSPHRLGLSPCVLDFCFCPQPSAHGASAPAEPSKLVNIERWSERECPSMDPNTAMATHHVQPLPWSWKTAARNKRLFLDNATKRLFVSSNVRALRSILETRLLSATYGPALVLYSGVVHRDGVLKCWPDSVRLQHV